MKKRFLFIITINISSLIIGMIIGYLFFYFFKNESVFLIEKFKILQNVFGIYEYSEGISYHYIFLVIFFGNIISTVSYFVLGYLKVSIPISFITGFYIIVFLFSGTIRHGVTLPAEVIILSSTEVIYRIIAMSNGEYIKKNGFRNKIIPIIAFIIIFIMFLVAVFYELYQLHLIFS